MFGLWTLNLEIQIQTCDLGTWELGLRTTDHRLDLGLRLVNKGRLQKKQNGYGSDTL